MRTLLTANPPSADLYNEYDLPMEDFANFKY